MRRTREIRLARGTIRGNLPRTIIVCAVDRLLRSERVFDIRLDFAFVSDAAIRKLHFDFMGLDSPTDVLTFVLSEPGQPVEAEIYVGFDTAARQARQFGVSRSNELVRLSVHGALHAIGYDDREPRARARMMEVQERIVRAAFSARAQQRKRGRRVRQSH